MVGQVAVANAEYTYLILRGKLAVDQTSGKHTEANYRIHLEAGKRVWASVSLLGIEGARLLALPDSVVFIDRINNRYYAGGYAWLEQQAGIPFDLRLLQDLLTGNLNAYTAAETRAVGDSTFVEFMQKGYRLRYALGATPVRPAGIETFAPGGERLAWLAYGPYSPQAGGLYPTSLTTEVRAGALQRVVLEHRSIESVTEAPAFAISIPEGFSAITPHGSHGK